MRKLALIGLLGLALSGCYGDLSEQVNKVCRPHGGVLSTDYQAGTVVCGDRVSRSIEP